MRNNSYAPHYAISRYSIREFKTGAEPFMVAIIIIIIIIIKYTPHWICPTIQWNKPQYLSYLYHPIKPQPLPMR